MNISVERVEFHEDFPVSSEAYAILTDGDRYAFAWGPTYPYADEVPAEDVPAGESGIEWHDTEDDARVAMNQAVESWVELGK